MFLSADFTRDCRNILHQIRGGLDTQTKELIMVGNGELIHGASMRVPFSLLEHRDTAQCVLLLAIKIDWSELCLIGKMCLIGKSATHRTLKILLNGSSQF